MEIIKKINNKIVRVMRNFYLFKIGAFLSHFKKASVPKDGPILIHIGCGEFNDKRYINVDSRKGLHIHYVDTIENISKLFPQNYADLIYGCHVLEHVSHLKLTQTLKGLYVCLKKGGILRLSVPDFETIVGMYQEKSSVSGIIAPLMGGQGYPGNFHFSVFDEEYLRNLLISVGFKEVRKWDPQNASFHSFDDWSKRKINLYNKEWPISLNIEAVK
ncbi:MAG: hypothetical protein PHI53_01435 [Candidatus Pacebacteria bacterium]|nr:hypothetical protein [Candidatus Paceibacterota bacterium]